MLPTRRDLVQLALRAAALPSGAQFFASWLRAADLRDYKPNFFGHDDFEALQAFTEILIPTDETPGAREAHCAHYIDFVLQAADLVPQMQKQWRDCLAVLKEVGFHSSDPKGRAALVEAMSKPERERGAAHRAYPAYRLIKQQTAFAFYTSRAGMIEALDYKGNSYNATFPPCNHPEHHVVG